MEQRFLLLKFDIRQKSLPLFVCCPIEFLKMPFPAPQRCLYTDLRFGANWGPLQDLPVLVHPYVGCFSWRSSGRSHTVTLFPIKKSFCSGSSGSHASKYIHFHRTCFVLEVQCFLGLLCSHSTQVGFLSDVRRATAPPPHPCLCPIMENTNKTRVPLPQPCVDLSWDPHRKTKQKSI